MHSPIYDLAEMGNGKAESHLLVLTGIAYAETRTNRLMSLGSFLPSSLLHPWKKHEEKVPSLL